MNIGKLTNIKIQQNMPNDKKISVSINQFSKELSSNKNLNDDIVSISNEAKALLAKNEELRLEKQALLLKEEEARMIEQMIIQFEEATDPSDNPHTIKLKCMIIAMRIMGGDRVPSKDMKFLAENDPEMYSQALLLQKQNDKPKKYKSLLEDDKNDYSDDMPPPVSLERVSDSVSKESVLTDGMEVSTESE